MGVLTRKGSQGYRSQRVTSALQKIVIKSQNTERVWSAWTDDGHIWFFTAEMSLELSRVPGASCGLMQSGWQAGDMATLGMFERRHVAAVHAVNGTFAVHGAVVVPPGLCAASVAYGDFDAHDGCTIEDSPCPFPRPLFVESLVQRFVASTRYVPQTAQRLFAPSDLPPALERVATQAQGCSQTWFAWNDGPRIWFVIAEMATVPGRQHQERAAIRMFFYDEDGRFVSWGTWALHSRGGWILRDR